MKEVKVSYRMQVICNVRSHSHVGALENKTLIVFPQIGHCWKEVI